MKKSITIIMLALIASLATAQNAVKAGDKISGNVCDETGPLISNKDLDQIMEERGMVKAEAGALEGDPVISNKNNPRVHVSLTDEEQALVTSVNDLGFNLIRTISLLNPKSILLSPLGPCRKV